MSVETVARRYALALADVVQKSGETTIVKDELKTWEEMITANRELQSAFSNPSIPHLSKEKVIESLLGKTKPSRTAANFLRILLRNGRLTELREINKKFAEVLDERSGVILAHVTSARPLSEAERADFQTNLAKLTGKQVNLNFVTDEKLIGGVVARVGSTVYDSSVKTQLENLKELLINA